MRMPKAGEAGVESSGYGMYVSINTKNAEGANEIRDIMHSWAPVMFKEEPSMYRKTVLGSNTATTKGYPAMKVQDCKMRVIM
jgi:hydroxymethylglutaryl-CoA reductase